MRSWHQLFRIRLVEYAKDKRHYWFVVDCSNGAAALRTEGSA